MAQKNFKVGEAIEVVYQAINAESAVVINMEVFDETHTIVAGGPTVLTELGSSGRYYGTFIPDAQGEWQVIIYEAGTGEGQVTKRCSVGAHNVHSVGAAIADVDAETLRSV